MLAQFHIESGAGATVAGIRVPRSEAIGLRLHRRRRIGPHPRVRGEARRPAGHADDPESDASPRWATTSSPPRCSSTPSSADADEDHLRPRHGWRHHPAAGGRRDGGASTTSTTTRCPAPPSATTGTGATSAPWTRSTTRTWIWSRCTRCSTCTTSAGRSGVSSENLAPAKFVNGGSAQESVVGAGSIISAASVRNSVLSSNVVIDDGAIVEGSVLMPGVRIGRGAVVRQRDPGQERRGRAPARWSASTWTRTVNASRSAPAAWSPSARASGSRRSACARRLAAQPPHLESPSRTRRTAATATRTSSGSSRIATKTSPTLVTSSTVLSTGAAIPAERDVGRPGAPRIWSATRRVR